MRLDRVTKSLLATDARAFARWALPGRSIVSAVEAPTEISLTRSMDRLVAVRVKGEREPLHLHIEIHARWHSTVPRRVFDYWSLAQLKVPRLRSLVIVLRRDAKQARSPEGLYEPEGSGTKLSFRFAVVCAWELEAQRLLESGDVGMLPFVPLAGDATEAQVERAQRILAKIKPESRSADLQIALTTFADWIFPAIDWRARMPEEIFMHSDFWKHHIEVAEAIVGARYAADAHAKGEAEGRKNIVGRQLRRALPAGARREAILEHLEECTAAQLTRLGDLVLEKRGEELLDAVERLVTKTPKTARRKRPAR